MGFILLKSGTITNISPKKTTVNTIISEFFILSFSLIIVVINICIGKVKKIIAARETEIKLIEPT